MPKNHKKELIIHNLEQEYLRIGELLLRPQAELDHRIKNKDIKKESAFVNQFFIALQKSKGRMFDKYLDRIFGRPPQAEEVEGSSQGLQLVISKQEMDL